MEDLDRMRAERDFNMNPPDTAPGQGDDGWGDIFGDSQSSSWDSNSLVMLIVLDMQEGTIKAIKINL